MTNTTHLSVAAQIRAAIKAAGYNVRQVTVRQPHSNVYVTIRDTKVSRSEVLSIAKRFEDVRRDAATDELLLGGTSVHVEYLPTLYADLVTEFITKLRAAQPGELVVLRGGFRASRDAEPSHLEPVWMKGPGFMEVGEHVYGVEHAAARIAVEYLDATARGAHAE